MPPEFSEHEEEILRFLKKQYDEQPKGRVSFHRLPRYEDVGCRGIEKICKRFYGLGILEPTNNPNVAYIIIDGVRQHLDRLDHPLPKDYWKRLFIWFRSKPWSIPVLVLAIVLPLLVQWVGMIKALLQWMGILE